MTELSAKALEERLQQETGTDETAMAEGGVKFDDDKIQMELIPGELLTAAATVLTFGAKKYSERNWEKGMNWGRVYGALQRHLNAWWAGEDRDQETGYSHLWHATCCIAFLVAFEARGIGHDDRPEIKSGHASDWEVRRKRYGLPSTDHDWKA